MSLRRMVHIKSRGELYPYSQIKRFVIFDDEVPWHITVDHYDPPEYNSKVLQNKPWADPPIGSPGFTPKWNELDSNINRKSHIALYKIKDGYPLNPEGRTGLKGRGVLGKWGPNHAADPIVTRWKIIDGKIKQHQRTSMPILQFCAIQRRDNGEWALPGGMVDPGEQVSETLRREFLEEALNSLESTPEQAQKDAEMIKQFFLHGNEIYKGYVDDPRNTDNAWIETVAVNFHDDDGETLGRMKLKAGDDAKTVTWMDMDKSLNLYASHSEFIEKVAKLQNAHW